MSHVMLDEMEAGRPPRGRSPIPLNAGRVTHAKAWLNKIFGLSGKLLKDHNAGVREDIAVCHKCGPAQGRPCQSMHELRNLRSRCFVCRLRRILCDPRSPSADKDRAERLLLRAQRYDVIKLTVILVTTVVIPLCLGRWYGVSRDVRA